MKAYDSWLCAFEKFQMNHILVQSRINFGRFPAKLLATVKPKLSVFSTFVRGTVGYGTNGTHNKIITGIHFKLSRF